MGIMSIVRKFSENRKEKSQKFKDMQEQDRLETMLEERKKSSNRRELEKYYKDKEEAQIKQALEKIRKQRTKDNWKGKSIMKSDYNILKEDKKILSNDRPILHQKNIFLDNKTRTPLTKKELFFKW